MDKDKSIGLWAAVLLLSGGIIQLIPAIYEGLKNLTRGFPYISVAIGALSIIVSLVIFSSEKQSSSANSSPTT